MTQFTLFKTFEQKSWYETFNRRTVELIFRPGETKPLLKSGANGELMANTDIDHLRSTARKFYNHTDMLTWLNTKVAPFFEGNVVPEQMVFEHKYMSPNGDDKRFVKVFWTPNGARIESKYDSVLASSASKSLTDVTEIINFYYGTENFKHFQANVLPWFPEANSVPAVVPTPEPILVAQVNLKFYHPFFQDEQVRSYRVLRDAPGKYRLETCVGSVNCILPRPWLREDFDNAVENVKGYVHADQGNDKTFDAIIRPYFATPAGVEGLPGPVGPVGITPATPYVVRTIDCPLDVHEIRQYRVVQEESGKLVLQTRIIDTVSYTSDWRVVEIEAARNNLKFSAHLKRGNDKLFERLIVPYFTNQQSTGGLITSLQEQVKALRTQAEGLANDKKILEQKVKDQQAGIDAKNSLLASYRVEAESLRKQFAEKDVMFKAEKQRVDNLIAKNADLHKCLSDLEVINKRLAVSTSMDRDMARDGHTVTAFISNEALSYGGSQYRQELILSAVSEVKNRLMSLAR